MEGSPNSDTVRVFLDVTWEVHQRADGWWEAQSSLNKRPLIARNQEKAVLLAQGQALQRLGTDLLRQAAFK